MKTKTRILITICLLVIVFSLAFAYRSCHKEEYLTQTEVASTDDGTKVITFVDENGNEYIKFGDGAIEPIAGGNK